MRKTYKKRSYVLIQHMCPDIELSKERTVPEMSDQQLWNETISRYLFAYNLVKGKRVLDAGCGCGYGSDILAKHCRSVLGVDSSADAIQYANSHYKRENLSYKQMSFPILDLDNEGFDAIVALEVIEHVKDQEKCISEFRRVLNKKGLLIVTTPNQKEHPGESFNPFHVHEMDYEEFHTLLKRYFKNVKILTFSFFLGMCILPFDSPTFEKLKIDTTLLKTDLEINPPFFIALCSDSKIDLKDIHILYPYTFSRITFFRYLQQMQDIAKKYFSRTETLNLIRYFIDTKNNYEVVLPFLEKLCQDEPLNSDWNYLMAFCLHRLKKDPSSAIKYYDVALQNGFEEFWVSYNRGLLYFEIGEKDKAKSDLTRALEINPSFSGLNEILKKMELSKE